jgi:energy-converting hydrogenase Eha subunit A
MSLSSAVNNLPAHVFGLLLLHATLDWYSGHRGRAVAYGPLSLLIALTCWEKSGLILVTVLALALYAREVPLRRWLRQSWPFAAALAVPVVAFGAVYLSHSHLTGRDSPGFGQLINLAGRAVAVPLGSLVGGPWRWSPIAMPFGLADAPTGAVLLGAIVALFLLMVAWRVDRRALLLWGSVLVYVLVTLIAVSYARFEAFGAIFTMHYHYWSDISIPLTLAVVLTARFARPRVSLARLAPAVIFCCVIAWVAGIVVSDVGFAKLWGKNPAKSYFDTVAADLDDAGPSVNLWDTSMPGSISTGLAADSRLSSVLRTAGIPFQLQGPASDPYIVDQSGHLRRAELGVWSRATAPPHCGLVLRGATSITLPLKSILPQTGEANWFAKIGYLTGREFRLQVELIDAAGKVAVMPEPATAWPANFATMYFGPSDRIRATSVRLRTTDPSTNLCVGTIDIGLPKVSG